MVPELVEGKKINYSLRRLFASEVCGAKKRGRLVFYPSTSSSLLGRVESEGCGVKKEGSLFSSLRQAQGPEIHFGP